MSLKIDYKKVSSAADAYKLVKANLSGEFMSKYKVKADFVYYDESNTISARGKGFDISMNFYDDHAAIDLDLSFLLKAFKSKILDTLESQIGKVI